MNLLPHIDVAEPERIAAILADPANYAWRAIDCETPGDWTPDLGITAYPNPSLVRVPGVAWSGQASTLRHRFWGTVERQCDHTGMRYVGVLLYDAAGLECPMEFRLGADDLGRVEPTRHDNRVHLIVLDQPVLHYLLAGDEFIRESIRETRNWLLQDHWFDHCEFGNCRESGWHIIHLCMLATAFDDPRCLNAAAVIVRRVREKEDPAGGWVHMHVAAHCGCGYPRCRGEAGFMVGVLLSALKRYHALTGDAEAARMLVGGVRWLIRNTYDAKSGHFRYTSCEKRTKGGTFQYTQWVLEGLANAYALSRDEEIGRYVRDGLKTIGHFPDWLDHLGLGKAMAMQMRYVPGIQAALGKPPSKEMNDNA